MPKYWGKQILTHGSFPEVGQKQKMERKKEGAKVGNNNGQLRIAIATLGGARKPPGPKVCVNDGQLRLGTPPRVVHSNCLDQHC